MRQDSALKEAEDASRFDVRAGAGQGGGGGRDGGEGGSGVVSYLFECLSPLVLHKELGTLLRDLGKTCGGRCGGGGAVWV